MNNKKKGIKSGTILTAVIVVLILIFAGLGLRTYLEKKRPAQPELQTQVQQPEAGSRGSGRNATVVRVTPVVRDTIENSVVINGDVLAVQQVSIFPTVAGKITETFFQVGDRVNQGAVVAMVDPSRPGQIYSDSPVVSTISGTVLQAPVHKGDTVSAQTAVYVVGDLSTLMVETFVPERFSNAARLGLPAQVFLEALPGESFEALVSELSPVLDPLSRTLRIRLRFSGRMDPRIKAGMFATVSLVTNVRRNIPVIPRTSAINTYGSWIVFTVNDKNIASRREVSLGLENENFVEVVNGLEIGERVVSAGQNFLSDGDPVRIVE
ncbi:MAG: efflux RND transporter periplasmic adaptor subunit [Treponema sp.]|nr:efflux RND transporter periplasmic adaptor subunit [Treponema sp.]